MWLDKGRQGPADNRHVSITDQSMRADEQTPLNIFDAYRRFKLLALKFLLCGSSDDAARWCLFELVGVTSSSGYNRRQRADGRDLHGSWCPASPSRAKQDPILIHEHWLQHSMKTPEDYGITGVQGYLLLRVGTAVGIRMVTPY